MPSNDTENIYSTQYGGEGQPIPARRVSYDNTESGLTSDETQGAIDELAADVSTLEETVGDETAGLVKNVSDLQSNMGDYQFVTSDVLIVAKDDTKTISTMLDELFAALVARKAELNDDEYIRFTGIYAHGLVRAADSALTLRSKTSPLSDLLCSSINAASNKFALQRIQLKTSGSVFLDCEISTGGNVITDLSNTAETIDHYNVKFEIFKKIR